MTALADLNVTAAETARDLLRSCADVPRWAEAVVAARPFDDVDSLVAHADALAGSWTRDDVRRALQAHPRIGERGTGPDAAVSAREQAGVGADTVLAERLRAGNVAYEARFGRVFLVRAAGRSGEEILEQLERRLGNDDDTELAETARQLREIAVLRLRTVVDP